MRRGSALLLLAIPLLVACGEKSEEAPPTGKAPSAAPTATFPTRSELIASCRDLLATEGDAAVARLLLTMITPPPRAPGEAERAAIDAAWELVARRRPREAIARLESVPEELGEARALGAFAHLVLGEREAFARAVALTLASGSEEGARRLLAGRMLARAGALEEAEAALRSTVDPRAPGCLARVLLARGQGAEAALAVTGPAVESDSPDLGTVRTHLLLLVLAGRHAEAEAMLEPLLPLATDDPELWEVEGALAMRTGDAARAVAAYEKVLDLDPDSTVAQLNLATILFAEGKRDEALDRLEAALTRPADADRVGRLHGAGELSILETGRALALGCYHLALRHLSRGSPREKAEGYLLRAVRADPEFSPAWTALSDVQLKAGDREAALATLREGAAAGRSDAVLMRLAVRSLMADDLEGFEAAAAGIDPSSLPGRALARLGKPGRGGRFVLPWGPRTALVPEARRHAALAEAFLGIPVEPDLDGPAFFALLRDCGVTPATSATLDPRAVLRSGRPVLVDRLVVADHGCLPSLVLVMGYDEGLGAYFADSPEAGGTLLVRDAELAGGLLYAPSPGEPGADPEAAAIDRALRLVVAGRITEARTALPAKSDHPLAAYAACRVALAMRDPMAVAIAADAVKRRPEYDALRMLLAETCLYSGAVGRAVQSVNLLEEKVGDLSVLAIVREIRGLAEFRPGNEEKAFRALEALRRERPDYLPVYETLSGMYLRLDRFREALEVLDGLERQAPGVRARDDYRRARRTTFRGIIQTSTTLAELEVALRARDPEVRKLLVRRAPVLRYREAVALLTRLCEDPDTNVRALAVRMLGGRTYRDGAEAVRKRLADEAALVRGAAARALRRLLGMKS
ncbi:MAG: tetratricopeptide repeat protein, partial [Planctomycetota bacterium]